MLQCGFVRANFSLAMSVALSSATTEHTGQTAETTNLSQPFRHLSSAPAVRSLLSVVRPLSSGAGEGNRTPVVSLEGCCSTIELHPQASGVMVEGVGFEPT